MECQLHGGKSYQKFISISLHPEVTSPLIHPQHSYSIKLKRAIDKLRAENNRSFNMGDRVSEMTSKYIPKENYRNVTEHLRFRDQLRTGGPSKTSFGASDSSLITHINPYLTTTNKDHRPFTSWVNWWRNHSWAIILFRTELSRYPKKDALTWWEFENYPKVWGHGSNDGKNIPKRKTLNQNEGMTDPTLGGIAIKSGISKIPARPSAAHVPNKGNDSFAICVGL